MRTFKTIAFTRFADKAGISDVALCRAVREAERGLVAADLGGGVIKQRIARSGQGKIWWISNADCIQGEHAGDFRSWFRQERKGQHREGRTDGVEETRCRATGLR